MFGLITAISMVFSAKEIIKEQIESNAPASMRFDWDAYRNDISKMSVQDQMKKVERGGYFTTKPIEPRTLSMEDVVDVERYKRDLELYGENFVEERRKIGSYKYIRRF